MRSSVIPGSLSASLSASALVGLVLGVTPACSKDEPPKEAPATLASVASSPPAPPAAAASAAPAAASPDAASANAAGAAKPLGERLRCEKLLPDSALLTFAAGFKVTQQPATQSKCPECGPACNLLMAGKAFEGAHVAYTCNVPFDKKAMDEKLQLLKKELAKAAPVKGFGRGGMHGEKDNGTFYSVVAFDDDTDCSVSVDWMRGKKDDTIALARAALAGIKPADLK